jgi:tetratricopeptide (TPR) repeat protein
LGAARSGDPVGAGRDVDELVRLRTKLAANNDAYWVTQIDIYTQAAEAWIALAEHRARRAVISMRAAAEREDHTEKNVAMENRLSPMRELLGELLLELGKPDEAQREFDASLQIVPNRYRSLAGAARAAGLLRHEEDARAYHERLLALTQDADSERPAILAARAYLESRSSPR